MEAKGPLLCSQEPTTGPYPEPDASIQPTPPHLISLRFSLILYSYLQLGLPSGFFPSGFPTKILYALLIAPMHTTCSTYFIYHPNNI
jgi:hypothetical protein